MTSEGPFQPEAFYDSVMTPRERGLKAQVEIFRLFDSGSN